MKSKTRKQTVTQRMMSEAAEVLRPLPHDPTRKQYLCDFKKFVRFCRERYDCRTLSACEQYIEAYSGWLEENSYAPSTIHTYLAAACAVYKVNMAEIPKPVRHTADYTRGRKTENNASSADLDDPRWAYVVDFQRKVGLRRNELAHLTGADFVYDESGHPCVFVRRGKGGKPQGQRISAQDEPFVRCYFEAVKPHEPIFSPHLFDNDLNFHLLRAECAKEYYYDQLAKLQADSAYAQTLEKEIRARWNATNRDKHGCLRPLPPSEIYGFYTLRGKNRALAMEKGLPLTYHKLALLATSIFKLSHWRNDVTVASYLLV